MFIIFQINKKRQLLLFFILGIVCINEVLSNSVNKFDSNFEIHPYKMLTHQEFFRNSNLKDSIKSSELFDIVNHTNNSIINFENNDSGILTQTSKHVNTGLSTVSITFKPQSNLKPIVNNSYSIKKQQNGTIVMDMKAILPLDLLNKSLEITYAGSDLLFPSEMDLNETLPPASGKFTLKDTKDKSIVLIYDVSISQRKFIGREKIKLQNTEIESFVYVYILKTKVNTEKIPFFEKEEVVKEWIVPKYGIIKQQRNGVQQSLPDKIKTTKSQSQTISSITLNN